jgi:nucleotide-binding universal stress UspA family protein
MVKLGDAAPEIARAAARMNCESIVMGSRGMGAVKSLVLGSTAMKVIHLATVPVTIVK